jgi:hypothetical protein
MGGAWCVLKGGVGTTGGVAGVVVVMKADERSNSVLISYSKAEQEITKWKVWLCLHIFGVPSPRSRV